MTAKSLRPTRRTLIYAALLLTLISIPALDTARAQTFRGAILGTVFDQTEAPIPNAQVTVKNQGTGLTRATMTDDTGNYHVPSSPSESTQ